MAPSAIIDGQIIGYIKGFQFQENNWQFDFQKTVWNKFEYEKELNKEKFQSTYLIEYEKGKVHREQIERKLLLKLGDISNQDKTIQDKYLNQITDIYYRISYLFGSWKERIDKEVFPVNSGISSVTELKTEAVNLIKNGKHQKSLQYLKELFLKKGQSTLYFEVLLIDSGLQELRINSKLKKITKEEYKNGLLEIGNQLSLMMMKIEK